MPAILKIGYVCKGTPENVESKAAKAVKCNFDFDHDDCRNSVADFIMHHSYSM